ncbi:hypothetical protein H5410_052541 [Solanum commersonii]|uniref:Uncharacterized protein n=1 Tax=Solanum commersonii TaxID=4109 RepID=A0A9J5X1R9_SOLCO|nr:hypothetical protein H5410_052541 [Solanum commersonii]
MEGRVEQVETNLTGVREDVRKLEGWFQEMTETLARIEAQGRTMMAEASPSQTRSLCDDAYHCNRKKKPCRRISNLTYSFQSKFYCNSNSLYADNLQRTMKKLQQPISGQGSKLLICAKRTTYRNS